nr:hypothetical protein [Nonomuraea basaltis]
MDEERLSRHDLTDEEWERLVPLLPVNPRQGGRWADHRMVINGVFFRTWIPPWCAPTSMPPERAWRRRPTSL